MPLAEKEKLDTQGIFRLTYAAIKTLHIEVAQSLLMKMKTSKKHEDLTQLEKAIITCKDRPFECW